MFPNKIEASVLTLSWIAAQYLVVYYLSYSGASWEAGNPIIYITVTVFSTMLIAIYSSRKMQLNLSMLFHANRNDSTTLIVLSLPPIIMFVLGFQVLLSDYFNVYTLIFPNATEMSKNIGSLMYNGFLGFVCVGVIAPFAEEIIFRGVILRGLLSSYGSTQAILFSSILFSLMHLNPDQLFHTLLIGIFFGWLYVRSFSLWPSIFAHMSFNTVVYMLNATDIKIQGINYFPNNVLVFPSLTLQLVSIGLIVSSVYLLKKVLWYTHSPNNPSQQD